jgi:hypothetical protein
MMRRIICFLRGHRWVKADTGLALLIGAKVCSRCHKVGYDAAAATVYGGIDRSEKEYWK